ncbi:MAG: hypothetical protein NC086_03660 [Alistipes sp.]|nr:hypothetical protein [Alistipes sp.]
MKYVYVLTSTEKDYYYEQCLISVTSLLHYNNAADVIVVTDNKTNDTLKGFRSELKKITNEIKIKKFEDSISMKVRSRLLKTSLRNLIDGEFLYIDIDTVISDRIDTVYSKKSIAMVLDQHCLLNNHINNNYLTSNAKTMKYSAGFEDKHFNSGVMLVKDDKISREFFKLWHLLYQETLEKGFDIDQLSLNEANCRMNGVIDELSGEWNVQVNCGLRYFADSKIIHYLGFQPLNKQNIYFNTLPFVLCDEKLLKKLKSSGSITSQIQEVIENPRIAFKSVTIIPDDCITYYLIFSNHMRVLKFIYVKFKFIFNFFEKIYGKLIKLIFKRA